MSIRALVLTMLLAALTATGAEAGRPRDLRAGPTPPVAGAPPLKAGTHAPSCYDSYSNIAIPNGFYFPAGPGVQILDDLHLGVVSVGDLCAFDLGYYKDGPGTTDATVTFYGNNPADDPPGQVLASFPVLGLPSGENGFHIEVPAASLTQDVWMGVSFSTANTGLLLADPPWPGASDDWFFMSPPGEYYNFGGSPRSVFMLGVYATGTPVDVPGDGEPPIVTGFRREPAPNPSTQGVDLGIALRDGGRVRAEVLDVSGRVIARVVDRLFEPGVHTLRWDGRTAQGGPAVAGVYLIRVAMPGFAGSRKVVLVR